MLRISIALAVALFAGQLSGAPPKQKRPPAKPPVKQLTPEEYAERLDAETESIQAFVKQCDANKAAEELRLKTDIAKLSKRRDLDEGDRQYLAAIRAALKDLPRQDPFEFPTEFTDDNIAVGIVGKGSHLRIDQIQGALEFVALARLSNPNGGNKDHKVLVQGISTEGLTDDTWIKDSTDLLFEVAETRKVGSRTMFVLRLIDLKALKDRLSR